MHLTVPLRGLPLLCAELQIQRNTVAIYHLDLNIISIVPNLNPAKFSNFDIIWVIL